MPARSETSRSGGEVRFLPGLHRPSKHLRRAFSRFKRFDKKNSFVPERNANCINSVSSFGSIVLTLLSVLERHSSLCYFTLAKFVENRKQPLKLTALFIWQVICSISKTTWTSLIGFNCPNRFFSISFDQWSNTCHLSYDIDQFCSGRNHHFSIIL
jgi:hypothetical protein